MNFNKEIIQNNKFTTFLKKYWIPIASVFVILLVALSLVGIYQEDILENEPGIELEKGTGLYFASGEIDSLNPLISQSSDTYYLTKLIYNGLFEFDDTFNAKPELVKSYKTNAEQGSITITLRTGIKFHNGKKLTANDVQFTINTIKTFGKKSPYYSKISKISNVSVSNDTKLTIQFKSNKNGSLDDLVFPVVPSSTHVSSKAFIDDDKNFKPVGTGQYKLSQYDYLNKIVLKPNKSYFGSAATQNICVQILPNKKYESKLLETYAVTCYATDSDDRKTIIKENNYKMYDMISNEVDFLVYNVKKGPFTNKTARQGVSYAIDVNKVITDGYMDDAVYTDNIFYPGFLGVANDSTSYRYNLEMAQNLFKNAGFTDKDSNGILEDKSGKEMKITILVNSNNVNRVAAAKIISKNLQNAGLDNTVVSVSWSDYTKKIARKEYDILITGYKMNADFDLRTFFNGKTKWGYKNNELLAKATELERLYSAEKYAELYSDLKKSMLDEMPYYALCYRKMGLVGVEHFETEKIPTFDDIYRYTEAWSWKKPVKTE